MSCALLVVAGCGEVKQSGSGGGKTNGQACTTSSECGSGFCTDGVCCNTACAGQCEACETGTCNPVAGAPHNARAACTGTGTTCGGTCDGTNRETCSYATASCAAASCNGSIYSAAASCSAGVCTPHTMDCSTTTDTKYCSPTTGCVGAIQLAAGYNFTCALMSDFTVKCWGNNDYGQLGQGTDAGGNPDTAARLVPTTVPNLTDVTKISIGTSDNTDGHVCAIKSDKTVVCWGANTFGQLGNGSTTNFSTANPKPAPLKQNSSTVQQNVNDIAAGKDFTCFIDTSSRAWCVGSNSSSELGDATNTMRLFPVQAGTAADYGTIWSGYSHTCATVGLSNTTSVRCWGSNATFESGVTSPTTVVTPTAAAGFTNVNASGMHPVGTGFSTSCAIANNSVLNCWGYNGRGQLGRGCDTVGGSCTAVASTATAGPVCLNSGPNCTGVGQAVNLTTSFAISEQSACAISTRTSGNTLYCWGKNLHAEFGNGTISPSFFAQASNAGAPVQVVMGAYHTCVLYADRTVKCAGWNADGQIGNNMVGGDVTTFVSPAF